MKLQELLRFGEIKVVADPRPSKSACRWFVLPQKLMAWGPPLDAEFWEQARFLLAL